jgi:hypothetical protein
VSHQVNRPGVILTRASEHSSNHTRLCVGVAITGAMEPVGIA